MSIYTTRPGIKGSTIYIKDSRSTKTAEVPEAVKELLKQYDSVDEDNLPEPKISKDCIFCGQPMERRKLIDTQTVALCDEHYFNKTTGEIAERLRSLDEKE